VPKSKIDETLKKIASETSKKKSKSLLTVELDHDLPGDPNCKYCGGLGYLRADVEPGHPDFGKLEACICRRRNIADSVRERLFSLSHLDELKGLTFESFQPHGRKGLGEFQANSLEIAFNSARHYAQNLNGWLILQGDYGCGKTHLAAAIANYAVSMGVPTLFLTVPDLLDTLRFSYDSLDTTFEQRFDDIRNAALLILDDFGTQNATGWAQEKLFQIINYRYINRLATVVTTNLSLEEIEERIRSRLADPELVTRSRIVASDFRRPIADMGHPKLSSLDLYGKHTFANFSLREDEGLELRHIKSLKDALNAAKAFADKPRGWLIFTGDYGSGKTHLAAAIANNLAGLSEPPLFIMIPDLLDELRKTFDGKSLVSFAHRFDEIRTASLLILDDLATHSLTPWARDKLFQIINYRLLAELPTVITISVDAASDLDVRIDSRLHDQKLCKRIGITAPAYFGTKRSTRKK
jgi:DNA replication protein DnaC